MLHLNNKAIVFTGSGRGIGAACARHAAGIGASVIINDIDQDVAELVASDIRSAGGRAVAHGADISDWDQAASLIERCVREFGKIDGLVNNAGTFAMATLEEMTPEHLRRILEVNVCGTGFCAAHALRAMRARGTGSIVNVTSGAQMGIPAMGAYGASKGAVATMTYTWAMELAGTAIRVNALSPRAETRMLEENRRYSAERGRTRNVADAPPENNAPVVSFLLSDAAQDVTGQVVRIDGHQLSLVGHPAIMAPVCEREGGWTIEAIEEAFRSDLAKRLAPLGVTTLKFGLA